MSENHLIESIRRKFANNITAAMKAAENGQSKLVHMFFTDLYFGHSYLGDNGFTDAMKAKEQVMDYVSDMGEDRAYIYEAQVPEELVQFYIEGLDDAEMKLVALRRGKLLAEILPGWFVDANDIYDDNLVDVMDNPFVLEGNPVPFKPCIVAKKVHFNPVNLASLE